MCNQFINYTCCQIESSELAEPCGILQCCEAGLVGNELANVFDT